MHILRALSIPPEKPGGAWGAKIQWLAGDGAEKWIVRRRATGADGQVLGPVVEVKVNGSAVDDCGMVCWPDYEVIGADEFEYFVMAIGANGKVRSLPAIAAVRLG